jgi:hypothetical protein
MRAPVLLLLLTAAVWPTTIRAGAPAAITSFVYSTSGSFGARYATLVPSGFGYWGEFKFNAPDHTPAYDTLSRRTVETVFRDPFREETIQTFTFSGGATFAIAEGAHLYGGAGWSIAIPWRRYFDSTGILGGNPGDYWIRDDARHTINASFGAVAAIGQIGSAPITASLGVETSPHGVVLGIGAGL